MQQRAHEHRFVNRIRLGRILALALLVLTVPDARGQAITPQVAAGAYFSAVLSSHGRVWTWGSNQGGQHGTCLQSSTAQGTLPAGPIPGLSNIIAIAAGGTHMLALTATAQVISWGSGNWGALGQGTINVSPCPQLLPSVSGATQISAGGEHSLVLLQNGTVLAFGSGTYGALGLGNMNHARTPTLIPTLTNVIAISAGGGHSAAVLSNGTLMVWGRNTLGQLGFTGANALSPVPVPGITGAIAVACGGNSTLTLDASGAVWQWGNTGNYAGVVPQMMVLPAPATAISSGHAGYAQMALLSTGVVCTWGYDCLGGTLGGGISGCGSGASPIMPTGVAPNVVGMTMGYFHAMTVSESGAVSSWGMNVYSELGYATPTTVSFTPGTIPGLDLTEYALYLVPVGGLTEFRLFHGSASSSYANVCSTVPQTGPTTGLANFGGLWISFNELLAWASLIQAGNPMATGGLNATGQTVVTLPMPNSQLSGITVHAVSFNLTLGLLTNISPVATHTF